VPVRALFSSFLLAVILAASITTGASAASKGPKEKIALGANKHAKKTKTVKAKTAKKAKNAAKRGSVKPSAAQPTRPHVVAPPAPAECANTTLVPDAGNLELIREAIVCLHNQIRAQNGLATLAHNAHLAVAAAGHSDDMVTTGYFDHNTPAGGTFVERVLAARYATADQTWTLGENLAWGTGELATPAGMMNAWMYSSGHRANILKGAYKEIGLGIHLGTPTSSAAGVTVSVEFGARA
jgi:uncharacterized protein YkwD